jgi:hypothetical protein
MMDWNRREQWGGKKRRTGALLPYLRAGGVAQVVPVELEAQKVVRVDHLVRNCVLGVSAVAHLVRADLDAEVGREVAAMVPRAAPAADVRRVEIALQLLDLRVKEADGGAYMEGGFYFSVIPPSLK